MDRSRDDPAGIFQPAGSCRLPARCAVGPDCGPQPRWRPGGLPRDHPADIAATILRSVGICGAGGSGLVADLALVPVWPRGAPRGAEGRGEIKSSATLIACAVRADGFSLLISRGNVDEGGTVIEGRGDSQLHDVPDGTVLFDEVCVLCSAWFRFVAARDPQARFRFVAIQGAYGRSLAFRLGIDPDNPQTNSVILGGRSYVRSDAALQILHRLPGWSWTQVALLLPLGPRDWAYDRVARNRYRLFGRMATCMVPSPALAGHMLPEIVVY